MPPLPADLPPATLVVESGRRLELAVRKLVPDSVDSDGKPLTLGPRMRTLRERLGPDAWRAFEAWSRERNAYTHAEITELADVDAFRQNFLVVERKLQALLKPKAVPKPRAKPRAKSTAKRRSLKSSPIATNLLLGFVIVAAIIVAYFSC